MGQTFLMNLHLKRLLPYSLSIFQILLLLDIQRLILLNRSIFFPVKKQFIYVIQYLTHFNILIIFYE